MRSPLFRANVAPSLLALGLLTGCVPLSESDLGALPETSASVDAESIGTELTDGEMVETDFGDEMPTAADDSVDGMTAARAPTTLGSVNFDEPDATTEVRVAVLARKTPVVQASSVETVQSDPSDSVLPDPASEPEAGELEASKQAALALTSGEALGASEPIAEPAEEPILGGWYVQISAETEAASAANLRDRIGELGLNAQLQRAIVDGTRYVRVLVGPYSSKAEAFAARGEVAPYQLGTGKPFVKHVR